MVIQLILLQIATFLALIFTLRLLFYKHLNSALKRLKELQEEALLKEAQIRDELDKAKQERLVEVERGRQEARKIVDAAKADAEVLREKSIENAKLESAKILEYSREESEKLKKRLLSDIEIQALDYAVRLVDYTFTQKIKAALWREAIEEAISEIERLEKVVFSVKSAKVKVIANCALAEGERARLKAVLSEKIGVDVQLEEEVDPHLVMGLVVKIGEFVIDGSLRNKLSKAAAYIKENRQ